MNVIEYLKDLVEDWRVQSEKWQNLCEIWHYKFKVALVFAVIGWTLLIVSFLCSVFK